MDTLGTRMRAAREAEKLSQLVVAAELGITKGALSAWENDKYLPQLDKFRGLCELYRISADALLFPDLAIGETQASYAARPSRDVSRLFGWIEGLTDTQRKGLLQFIDG